MERVCVRCGTLKELTIKNFRQCLDRKKNPIYFRKKCISCEKEEGSEYRKQHSEIYNERTRRFIKDNPSYRENYKFKNKQKIREYQANYEKQIHIKLKKRVSRRIKHALTNRNATKISRTLSFLPYSIEELKLHLESRFESWMNWDNWAFIIQANGMKTILVHGLGN